MSAAGADAEAAQSAPATVVLSQSVKPGRDEDFRRWQEGLNRAVASFDGFLGTEVVPPGGEDREWTVIYRFGSRPQLEQWLASSARAEHLDRGADLFDAPASQQVLIGKPAEEFVTVVVSHPVDADQVEEFLAWQQRVIESERTFPGFGGSELFRPVPGAQDEWTTVFRFDTQEHLDGWLESPERKRLLEEGADFHEFELRRIASPFGSWFAFGDEGEAEAPAQWKTALSVLVGLYPTVVLLTLGISEIWEDGKLWETLLLGNILSVSLLTWVVMPIVTGALRFWLAPDPRQASPRLDALGAAVSVAFLTLAAIVFWLVTTQIWTLP